MLQITSGGMELGSARCDICKTESETLTGLCVYLRAPVYRKAADANSLQPADANWALSSVITSSLAATQQERVNKDTDIDVDHLQKLHKDLTNVLPHDVVLIGWEWQTVCGRIIGLRALTQHVAFLPRMRNKCLPAEASQLWKTARN